MEDFLEQKLPVNEAPLATQRTLQTVASDPSSSQRSTGGTGRRQVELTCPDPAVRSHPFWNRTQFRRTLNALARPNRYHCSEPETMGAGRRHDHGKPQEHQRPAGSYTCL